MTVVQSVMSPCLSAFVHCLYNVRGTLAYDSLLHVVLFSFPVSLASYPGSFSHSVHGLGTRLAFSQLFDHTMYIVQLTS